MKRQRIVVCLFMALLCISVLPGCSSEQGKYKHVEHVGQVPESFKSIVANNIFKDVTAFDERLLKAETIATDEETRTVTHQVQMMDLYGRPIATYTCRSDDAYHVDTLTATKDGGFLFVLGFSDYAYENMWASDKGYASRVIKCDKIGNLLFDTTFDRIEGFALRYCFEKNRNFYFFGTIETPETKMQGVHSPTDIYMVILSENGSILKSQCIAGSDYDHLDMPEISGDYFVLSIHSQSDDGDFINSGSNGYPTDWVFTVDDDLKIVDKKKESGRNFFDDRIGEKDGTPIHRSDEFLKNFDAGTPTVFIDYDDFYLVVSQNTTGEYEKTPPWISSIWYYSETVYSAYDYDGNLIFRTAVDSSPDFDSFFQNLLPYNRNHDMIGSSI